MTALTAMSSQNAGASKTEGAQIIRQAIAATSAAHSIHITGTIESDMTKVGIDVTMSQTAASGTITEDAKPVKFRRIEQSVFVMDPSTRPGVWVAISSSASIHNLVMVFNPNGFVTKFFPVLNSYGFTGIHHLQRDGRTVLSLVGSNGNERDTFIVAASSPHYFLAISSSGHSSSTGDMSFTQYNKPLHVAVPPTSGGIQT